MTADEQALKDLEAGWARLGVEIDASISTDTYGRRNLHLSRIVVEKGRRGQGLGTKAMEDLVALADQYGMLTTLSPSTDFGASSKERLKKFYRRFGFVSNKGRHKDFTLFDSMYRSKMSGSGIPKLYHGTLTENLPEILANGINVGEGWGGAGTSGTFLSASPEGALYWAKMAYQRTHGEKMEVYGFDRDHGREADNLLAVIEVQIPEDQAGKLMADEEQFEDVGARFSPGDWKQSLKVIGDVRFNGPVPRPWIGNIINPTDIK